MEIESFNSRFFKAPKIETLLVESKSYEEKVSFDENGIEHISLVEKTRPEFLDTNFRDYSISSYKATGEIQRLQFITPYAPSKFDAVDGITSASEDLSLRLDRMDAIAAAAAAAEASREVPANVES